jgi:hypothetical protein
MLNTLNVLHVNVYRTWLARQQQATTNMSALTKPKIALLDTVTKNNFGKVQAHLHTFLQSSTTITLLGTGNITIVLHYYWQVQAKHKHPRNNTTASQGSQSSHTASNSLELRI